MWARLVADGIEIHRDAEPRPADALDVVDRRPTYDPVTHELVGPSWKLDGGVVVAVYEAVPVDRERVAQQAADVRVVAALDKARAMLADPARSADWTAAERKLLLAALVLDATR